MEKKSAAGERILRFLLAQRGTANVNSPARPHSRAQTGTFACGPSSGSSDEFFQGGQYGMQAQSEYSSHRVGARHGGGQAVCRRAQARRAWELARTRFLVPFWRSAKKGQEKLKRILAAVTMESGKTISFASRSASAFPTPLPQPAAGTGCSAPPPTSTPMHHPTASFGA